MTDKNFTVQQRYKGIIPEQFNAGYKYGSADARIMEDGKKPNRWISVNNINHKHDDWIRGYCTGFIQQKDRMDSDDMEIDARNGVEYPK